MSSSLQVQISLGLTLKQRHDATQSQLQLLDTLEQSVASSGTAAYLAQTPLYFTQAIAAATPVDVDLLAGPDVGVGAGRDHLGQTYAPSALVGLVIDVQSTGGQSLAVGGAGSNAWTGLTPGNTTQAIVLGQGTHMFYNGQSGGLGVIDATHKLLRLNNAGSGTLVIGVYAIVR